MQGRQRKLYFVTGHGEHDPNSTDPIAGYSRANEALQRDNCLIVPLAIAQQTEVPADADVVIVAGPTRDFLPAEIESLRRYLNRGGKALMLLDPPDTTTAPPLTNLVAFAAEWGIQVGNDIVVDVAGQARGRGPGFPVIASYPEHPITKGFRFYTMFPLARTVSPIANSPRNAQPLLQSSELSWAETDLKALPEGRPVSEGPEDRKGPVDLGSAVSLPAPDAPPPAPAPAGQPPPPHAETRLVDPRRLRLRRQRGHRLPGQPRPARQRGQLAGAAGKSDLDPAGAGRTIGASPWTPTTSGSSWRSCWSASPVSSSASAS